MKLTTLEAFVLLVCLMANQVLGVGKAQFDVYEYQDLGGLRVTTTHTQVEKSIAPGWLLLGHLLWDRIAVESPESGAPADGGHVHMHKRAISLVEPDEEDVSDPLVVDGTSGASQRASTASGGTVQNRIEGAIGIAHQIGHGPKPYRLGSKFSVSSETDYLAMTGIADASVELFQRNVILSAYLGIGWDRVNPIVPPPGEADLWPAYQYRYLIGCGYTQVTGTKSLVSIAYGLGIQNGSLESPYRRARVISTLFPEQLPNLRLRHHAAFSWSYSPWQSWGFHHREGFYLDSWNYHAWIPETAINWDGFNAFTFTARHRFTRQDAAEFWQHHYENLTGFRSGDFRLDGLTQHALTLEVAWRGNLGYQAFTLSGHITRFWQQSQTSSANPKGWTFGLASQLEW